LRPSSGENRSTAFCYIQASHDLDAVRAYLNRYRDQPKTLRAYTEELERFLLWAVVLRGKALSDLRVDDCEAYKDLLKSPDPRFVGDRFARHSTRWRPFASNELTAESQRYAVRLLRSAFAWWVDVRYLAGNPWVAVNDPPVIRHANTMKIDRALPAELWRNCVTSSMCDVVIRSRHNGGRCATTILLMGDSGLRREEAASARREHPRAVHVYGTLERSVWELTIIGKGQRERTVPVSAATLAALRAHWARPGRAFDEERVGEGPGGRLAPTSSAEACWRERRSSVLPKVDEAGYTADGLNRLIGCMTKKFVETMDALSRDERMRLGQVNAHAFRHKFGTQSVAEGAGRCRPEGARSRVVADDDHLCPGGKTACGRRGGRLLHAARQPVSRC
jgi:integrase